MHEPKLLLLGPPLLERNGVPVRLATRKALGLLAYLAVTGRAHRRETLVTLLWPESGRTSGQAGLRNVLHALRQAKKWIVDRDMLSKLFDDVAPRFSERAGGYTRIVKLGRRISDSSEMVLLEWVDSIAAPAPAAEETPAPAE